MNIKVRRVIVALALVAAPVLLLAVPSPAQADNTWCLKAGVSTTGPAEPTTGHCATTPTDWWEGCQGHGGHVYVHGDDAEVWFQTQECYAAP